MRQVVIASAVRTAIGSFGGAISKIPAAVLGEIVIREALIRAGVSGDAVEEVIMGCTLQAGLGQNVARQAALRAGLPQETPSLTINKVCGSGLKAVLLAAQAIRAGEADVIVAGGTENMSNSPFVMENYRWGGRMGHGTLLDVMIKDGLWCAQNDVHMGITAENIAAKYGISREEQDQFAVTSQNKAEAAQAAGRFVDEIVAVPVPAGKGDPVPFLVDEYPKKGATLEAAAKLRPAFKKDGSVTAANASGINDGAAALVVMSAERARQLGVTPLAVIEAGASCGVDPALMGMGPVPSSKRALERAGLRVADLDLVEANEAFAVQALAVAKHLELDPAKTNVNGGAIALGHPIGASGARILVTLLHEMRRSNAKKGLATLCIGGGQGVAMVVSR